MHFLRHLSLSSRLLLGLMAVAAGVGVGSEVLRPGHHVHLGIGGHHHHWHAGPHSHRDEVASAIASEVPGTHTEVPGTHHPGTHHPEVPGTHAETHHRDVPGDDGPLPSQHDEGAFVDAFPLQEAASYFVLGASSADGGTALHVAPTYRATALLFLPISPRGPPSSLSA